MRIILFGTVIRTRKSLERIMIKAIKEGRQDSASFKWALSVYNTGIFGLLFYRTNENSVGLDYFKAKISK